LTAVGLRLLNILESFFSMLVLQMPNT